VILAIKRSQAYPFQSEPKGEQCRNLRHFAGSCRFVYNKALALQKANYEAGHKFIGYRNSRDILGTAKNITVSSNGGKWFVSIQTERKVEPPIPVSSTAIGIAHARKDFLHKTTTTLPSTTLRAAQPKPRVRLCRRCAGAEPVPVFKRHA
jgi:hypothetical protein